MLIQFASDLHLEFDANRQYINQQPIISSGQVLVLAGDITSLNYYRFRNWERNFFEQLADQYEQVIWIPGNHEYYRSRDLADDSPTLAENLHINVRLVNNQTLVYSGVRFVCSTLWSHIPPHKTPYIQRYLNDFHLLNYNGQRLTTEIYNQLHQQAISFLERELSKPFAGPTVVVTHHVPSFACEHPKHLGSPLSTAFVSEQSSLMAHYKPDYWIYGHSHGNIPLVQINQTRLVTNQLGYVSRGEHTAFRQEAVLTVDAAA